MTERAARLGMAARVACQQACQAMPRVRKAVPSDPCAKVSPHSCAALRASRATFGATQPRVRAVRMAALPPRPARAANTLRHAPGCSLAAASEPLSAIAYAVRVGSLVLIAAPLVGRVPQPALVSSVRCSPLAPIQCRGHRR